MPYGDIFFVGNKNIEKFKWGKPKNLDYLKVDELRKKYWGFKLNKENNKPKVDFVGQALSLVTVDTPYRLENWESVLSRKDIDL